MSEPKKLKVKYKPKPKESKPKEQPLNSAMLDAFKQAVEGES